MKTLLKIEELSLFILCYLAFLYFEGVWYLFWVFILLPDIGMIGYLINTKVGAISYNLIHHKAIAVITILVGFILSINFLILSGIILFAHSSIDRAMGYGLKYMDDFKNTHLGRIGK